MACCPTVETPTSRTPPSERVNVPSSMSLSSTTPSVSNHRGSCGALIVHIAASCGNWMVSEVAICSSSSVGSSVVPVLANVASIKALCLPAMACACIFRSSIACWSIPTARYLGFMVVRSEGSCPQPEKACEKGTNPQVLGSTINNCPGIPGVPPNPRNPPDLPVPEVIKACQSAVQYSKASTRSKGLARGSKSSTSPRPCSFRNLVMSTRSWAVQRSTLIATLGSLRIGSISTVTGWGARILKGMAVFLRCSQSRTRCPSSSSSSPSSPFGLSDLATESVTPSKESSMMP